MELAVIDGDLLDPPADVIVDTWNRGVSRRWLLLPPGESSGSGRVERRRR